VGASAVNRIDLAEIRTKYLRTCAVHDADLPEYGSCACPEEGLDMRWLVQKLVTHIEDLYNNHDILLCSTQGEALDRIRAADVALFLRSLRFAAYILQAELGPGGVAEDDQDREGWDSARQWLLDSADLGEGGRIPYHMWRTFDVKEEER
jgi:hypothetical protein